MSVEFATETEVLALQGAAINLEKVLYRLNQGEYGFGDPAAALPAPTDVITAMDAAVTALKTAVDAVDAAVSV